MPRGPSIEIGRVPAVETAASAAVHVLTLCWEDYGEAGSQRAEGSFR